MTKARILNRRAARAEQPVERETFKRPRKHADADKIVAALGLSWPDGVASLSEKVSYLSTVADLA